MVVNDSNIISGLSLTSVDIENNSVKLTFKNGATFILSPQNIEEKIEYQMEYLTGKDNKQIKKLQEKIQVLEDEVKKIIETGVPNNSSAEEKDLEDDIE